MGWNDKDGKDPWSGKQEPPDIDAALQALLKKLKGTFQPPSNKRGKKINTPIPPMPNQRWFIIFGAIVLTLWFFSGIFIVDPAEQAVIQRFGRYTETLGPGPHWIPRFICTKTVKNVERVSDYSYSAQMLTKDENLVSVALAVQYRIDDLEAYLFNVADPLESLRQATSSALRQVVGNTTLDQIITEGREAWGASVQESLIAILKTYQTGIKIVNVSPQPARAPENVQDAFDDAIKAQEDEKRFKEQAYAYEANVVPIAEGNAKRILQEAEAYSKQRVLKAKGEVSEYLALLPEYLRAPQVTSERLYLETMQQVLANTPKVLADTKSSNLLYLPLDKLLPNRTATSRVPEAPELQSSNTEKDSTSSLDTAMQRPDVRPTTRPTIREE